MSKAITAPGLGTLVGLLHWWYNDFFHDFHQNFVILSSKSQNFDENREKKACEAIMTLIISPAVGFCMGIIGEFRAMIRLALFWEYRVSDSFETATKACDPCYLPAPIKKHASSSTSRPLIEDSQIVAESTGA